MRVPAWTPPPIIRRCRYRLDRERWQVPRSVWSRSRFLERPSNFRQLCSPKIPVRQLRERDAVGGSAAKGH